MQNEVYEMIEEQLPSIRRYAHALERNPHAAEDLIQDCVERALSRQEQFQPGTNLRTWMFTIMHNLQCDRKRKDVRRGVHVPLEEWSDGEGMAYEEAAEVLEIKVGTVKSRLFRARERLREIQTQAAAPKMRRRREQSAQNAVHAM